MGLRPLHSLAHSTTTFPDFLLVIFVEFHAFYFEGETHIWPQDELLATEPALSGTGEQPRKRTPAWRPLPAAAAAVAVGTGGVGSSGDDEEPEAQPEPAEELVVAVMSAAEDTPVAAMGGLAEAEEEAAAAAAGKTFPLRCVFPLPSQLRQCRSRADSASPGT